MTKNHPIGKQIKDKYGTIKHFAKVANINYHTLRNVIYGKHTSKPLMEKLKTYWIVA